MATEFDAVIFDLDGTLWDAVEVVARSWNQVLCELGAPERVTCDELRSCMGMLFSDIVKKLLKCRDAAELRRIIDLCCERECALLDSTKDIVYPDAKETLCALEKKYKLCIVSNCQCGYIESFFKSSGFSHFFTDYDCAGGTGLDKAGTILQIVERNGFKSPVYVGDTDGDAAACEKAGVPFVFASYGFGDTKRYFRRIESLSELPDVLAFKK